MLDDAGVDVAVFPNYAVPLAAPCPTVVVVHDLTILRMPQHCTLQKRLLMAPMLRQSVKVASVIATVSEASQRDIESFLGVSRSRIALLPGAAHPSCRPASPDAVATVRARHGLARPYILTVGTLEPRKDLVTLLRALNRLERELPDHDLVVVGGRGWQDRHLVQALEARMQSQRVRWLGYVSESDLVALYTGADLFVFTSMFEGFGLPVLEAMACGAPVVASDVAALREVGGDVRALRASRRPRRVRADHRRCAPRSRGARVGAARRTGPGGALLLDPHRGGALGAGTQRRVRPHSREPGARHAGPRARALARAAPPGALRAHRARVGAPRDGRLRGSLRLAAPNRARRPRELRRGARRGRIHRMVRSPALSSLVSFDRGGFLVLAGREHLLDAIPEREEATRKLLDANRGILASLSALPFVRALVISGGVAHRNPGRRPDVDFFAVTARGRAYTAYTALFLATKLTGTRHVICPNYLVEESELAIAYHHDVFTAHQLVSALPFSGKHTYEALCRANEGSRSAGSSPRSSRATRWIPAPDRPRCSGWASSRWRRSLRCSRALSGRRGASACGSAPRPPAAGRRPRHRHPEAAPLGLPPPRPRPLQPPARRAPHPGPRADCAERAELEPVGT